MSEQCVGLLSPADSWSVSLREVLILPSLLKKPSARKIMSISKHWQAGAESFSEKGWEKSTAEGKVMAGLAQQDSVVTGVCGFGAPAPGVARETHRP